MIWTAIAAVVFALILTTMPGGLSAASASPVQVAPAAQPPAGYPTSQVMGTAYNSKLGYIPIRRGFWDHEAAGGRGQGFGYDKAWNYHRMWSSVGGIMWLMGSPNGASAPQPNGNYMLTAYVYKKFCSGPGSTNCTYTDSRQIAGIYASNSSNGIGGWPVGSGKIGLLTAYCVNPGGPTVTACPTWVGAAMSAQSTFSGRSSNGTIEVTSEQATQAAEQLRASVPPGATMPPQLPSEQARGANSGTTSYLLSYEPLTK